MAFQSGQNCQWFSWSKPVPILWSKLILYVLRSCKFSWSLGQSHSDQILMLKTYSIPTTKFLCSKPIPNFMVIHNFFDLRPTLKPVTLSCLPAVFFDSLRPHYQVVCAMNTVLQINNLPMPLLSTAVANWWNVLWMLKSAQITIRSGSDPHVVGVCGSFVLLYMVVVLYILKITGFTYGARSNFWSNVYRYSATVTFTWLNLE